MLRCAIVCIVALSATSTVRATDEEDANLAAFFKDYLEKVFKQRPLLATQLGDHRFDDQLDDVSAKSRAGWAELVRQTLEALPQKVDYKKLSRSGQIDYEIFEHDLMAGERDGAAQPVWSAAQTSDPRVARHAGC